MNTMCGKICLFLLLVSPCLAMDNLRVAYQWKQVDFDFPSEEARTRAIQNREFIPENNLPLGLEVWGDRLFVTVPRWKEGVAASLTYINLTDTSESPKLKPYPNWEAHHISNSSIPEIISPFRVRADKCGRLWVLDTGTMNILEDSSTALQTTQILVYDLHNDSLRRRYIIPQEQLKNDSFFATLAIEDDDCENTFAYFADISTAGLVVYSWKNQSSWRITHHYFNIDPTAGEFDVQGIKFQWMDHIFGIALSSPDAEGYATLYFHPMVSTNEFSVSTKYLRDPNIINDPDYKEKYFHNFKLLGSRGPKAQSSVSFLDKKTGVLFYALVNLNAIACWRTSIPNYNMQSQGRVYMSNVTMVFPNDIKVDNSGNLWVLSDRLPEFMYSQLDKNDVNFRILTASVQDAIRGTACDSKLVVPATPNVGNRFNKPISSTPKSSAYHNSVHLCLYAVAMVTMLLV